MAGETKFLDLTGLSTFLNNIKYNYAQGSEGYIPLKASQLETARTISLTGDITGSVSFDGTQNVSIATTAGAGVANVVENVGWKQSGASTITWLTPSTVDGKSKAVYIDLSDYALKSDYTAIMDFKGVKATASELPSSGMETGDVWVVSADNSEYVYTGSAWEKLGPTIDLSGYVQTSRTINSKALSSDIVLDGSDIALSSGYAVASTAAAPAAGDSIDVAVGKLQKEIVDANAAATTYAFAEGSTNGAFQVTPTVGGVAGQAQSVEIHGLGSAAYAETTDFVPSTLTPAEAGAQKNVIEAITINGASTGVSVTGTTADLTIAADVADVQTKTASDGSYASVLDANKIAKIDLSGYATTASLGSAAYEDTTAFVSSTLTPAEAGAQVNDIEIVKFKGKGDASASALSIDSSDKSVTIDVSGYALTSDLANFITLTALSTTDSGNGDYVTGVSYNNATGVFTVTKAAKGSVADNQTGLVDGDTVYDYFEAHKADGNVIETVKVNGTALTPDANKAVDITAVTDVQTSANGTDYSSVVSNGVAQIDLSNYALDEDIPVQATAIADNDDGYATGDQVYDYIQSLPIPDASIEALFPANPS